MIQMSVIRLAVKLNDDFERSAVEVFNCIFVNFSAPDSAASSRQACDWFFINVIILKLFL